MSCEKVLRVQILAGQRCNGTLKKRGTRQWTGPAAGEGGNPCQCSAFNFLPPRVIKHTAKIPVATTGGASSNLAVEPPGENSGELRTVRSVCLRRTPRRHFGPEDSSLSRYGAQMSRENGAPAFRTRNPLINHIKLPSLPSLHTVS